MKILTFDIETIPQERFTLPSVEVDQKWLNEQMEKEWPQDAVDWLEASIASGEAKLAGTGMQAALHPTTAHVIAVSFGKKLSNGEIRTRVDAADVHRQDGIPDIPASESESILIGGVLNTIAEAVQESYTLVSFNGKGFDIPMIRWRAAILGVTVPPSIVWDGPPHRGTDWHAGLLYPYDTNAHCDLRMVLGGNNRYAKGTLKWWSEAFGIESVEHGADVFKWVKAGRWDELRSYGKDEAMNLIALYERCRGVL